MSQPGPFGPSPPSPNPFQASAVAKPAAAPEPIGPFTIEYMRSYNYIFENPNWVMNVLWGFLCILSTAVIPILGQLVLMGYQYEVVESLYLVRGARYPDFDINRFADYLGRSIWPFLVNLVVGLVLAPIIVIAALVLLGLTGAAASAAGDDVGPLIAGLGMLLMFVVLIALSIGMVIVILPMTLRAGLQQDFGAAFDFAWVKDFVGRTWVEMVLTTLFLMFSSIVVVLLGLLAFCVGMYAGVAVVMLAQAHIMYQLYMLYLSRGGTPIPLKPRLPVPQPGFAPPPRQY
jgi:hypothetical protein